MGMILNLLLISSSPKYFFGTRICRKQYPKKSGALSHQLIGIDQDRKRNGHIQGTTRQDFLDLRPPDGEVVISG